MAIVIDSTLIRSIFSIIKCTYQGRSYNEDNPEAVLRTREVSNKSPGAVIALTATSSISPHRPSPSILSLSKEWPLQRNASVSTPKSAPTFPFNTRTPWLHVSRSSVPSTRGYSLSRERFLSLLRNPLPHSTHLRKPRTLSYLMLTTAMNLLLEKHKRSQPFGLGACFLFLLQITVLNVGRIDQS